MHEALYDTVTVTAAAVTKHLPGTPTVRKELPCKLAFCWPGGANYRKPCNCKTV